MLQIIMVLNVMDEIYYNNEDGIKRKTNQLGGIEGGMTTGEELVIRCAMKPIPTLYKPLKSININTLESYSASIERSDNCAVPACSVVCENVVAFVICKYFLDKIGGDNLNDLKSNYNTYIKRLGDRGWEKIINEVCNIVIDNSYKNFTSSVYEFNNKNIEDLSRININEIYDEVLIISDENVYNYQLDNFINNIKAKMIYEYIVPEGEDSKSLSVYEEIIKYCIRINLSRKSLIIALGGGVVGDLAGFVCIYIYERY